MSEYAVAAILLYLSCLLALLASVRMVRSQFDLHNIVDLHRHYILYFVIR